MQCLAGIWTCTTVLFYIILVFWIFVDLSETHVVICGMVSVLKILNSKGGDMHLSSTYMKASNISMILIWILCFLSDTEILYYYQFQKNTVFEECRSNEILNGEVSLIITNCIYVEFPISCWWWVIIRYPISIWCFKSQAPFQHREKRAKDSWIESGVWVICRFGKLFLDKNVSFSSVSWL